MSTITRFKLYFSFSKKGYVNWTGSNGCSWLCVHSCYGSFSWFRCVICNCIKSLISYKKLNIHRHPIFNSNLLQQQFVVTAVRKKKDLFCTLVASAVGIQVRCLLVFLDGVSLFLMPCQKQYSSHWYHLTGITLHPTDYKQTMPSLWPGDRCQAISMLMWICDWILTET